ncbi:hypothetical protein OIE68_19090 [Nocardia vinacea]|uniref:hypothetical protein n=1 Tax=Nocardia vinacea TaxID=96468 RepID=UPI002E1409C3|nr:hypothetical protein OIE68_19090 [Nocardia vinacea]
MRYRLAVIAPDIADVVRYSGGWLFDRAMAGWEVTVCVGDVADIRPLRILGATVLDLETSMASLSDAGVWPNGIAVAAKVFETDPRVHQGVLKNIEDRSLEVTVWGAACPSELDCRTEGVQHRLSVAARAFKARALAALAQPVDVLEDVEMFRCSETREHLAADLLPVG